jgi:hypothetical protein
VDASLGHGDPVQRAVELSVAAAVEAAVLVLRMKFSLSGGRLCTFS